MNNESAFPVALVMVAFVPSLSLLDVGKGFLVNVSELLLNDCLRWGNLAYVANHRGLSKRFQLAF